MTGNQMSSMRYYILIFCAISTLTFYTDCLHTEVQLCKPGICNNGDCFETINSIIIGPERDGFHTKCPYGLDHYAGLCYRVDKEKKSWFQAREDTDTDQLAIFSFVDNTVRFTAAEYLKSKLSDDLSPVWIYLLLEEVSSLSYKLPPCFALEPANYTFWEIHGCRTARYSLRTAPVARIPNNNIMCRCHPGYTGRWCNIIDTELRTQELTNPAALQCPNNKLIFVEFAIFGYTASVSLTAKECHEPNMLPLLRYLCQGKNKCNLGQQFQTQYITPFCSKKYAMLTVRYSCMNASELSCSRGITKMDQTSINCMLPIYQNVSWQAAMDFCLANGGQLAAFSGGLYHINFGEDERFSKAVKSFWTFDEHPEIRPDPREPEECNMATSENIKPNLYKLHMSRDCSKKLPALCAIPPFHQVDTMVDFTMDPELNNAAEQMPWFATVFITFLSLSAIILTIMCLTCILYAARCKALAPVCTSCSIGTKTSDIE